MGRHHYLFNGLRLSPAAVRSIVTAVPDSLYDTALDPDRFTLRFALSHLVDWEPIMLSRIKACVEQPGTMIYGIDEGQRAIDEHYENWDVLETLDRFDKGRAEIVAYCQGLSPEEWARTAVHNERGEMSALDWAWTIVGHDMYHIEQFAAYLRA
ncbi:MAG: DinB family protein [Armatimonadetes bacterium]|nr:DinB family protein [Armatimonadota bacterium]